MQENPQVRIEEVVSRFPLSPTTSMATRKRLCDSIQCVVMEIARMGMT